MAGSCIALGAAAGPPLAGAGADKIEDVVIRNAATEPVPVRNRATVAIEGDVSVPGGVTLTGPVAVEAPQRVQRLHRISHAGSGDETCEPIDAPAGRRFVLDAAHFELRGPASAEPEGSVRSQHQFPNGTNHPTNHAPQRIDSRTRDGVTTATRRLEGPLIADDPDTMARFTLHICVGEATTARVTVVGRLEET